MSFSSTLTWAHGLLYFKFPKASSREGNKRNKEPWKMMKSREKNLHIFNAISMSFWAFKLYNEWSRSDTLLRGIKKAQREKNAQKKDEKTWRISYQPSIKHLENVISIFVFFPQLHDRFFDNFSDFKCFDNVKLRISFYFYLFFCLSWKLFFLKHFFWCLHSTALVLSEKRMMCLSSGYLSAWSI